MIRIVS